MRLIRGVVTAFYKFIWHLGPEVGGYFGVVVGLVAANATDLSGWWLHLLQGGLAGFVGENTGYYGVMYLQLRFLPLRTKLVMHVVGAGFPEKPKLRPIIKEIAVAYGVAEVTDWIMRFVITTWVMASLASSDSFVSRTAAFLGIENDALIAKGFAEAYFYSLIILTAIGRWQWRRRKRPPAESTIQQWEPTS